MRSSRVSRETAALVGRVQQLDSMQTRRVTRSALARFAYEEPVADIEDIAGPTPRKRRRIVKEEDADAGPSTSRTAVKAEAKTKRETSVSSRTETAVKAELPVKTEPDATTPARKRRLPARVIRGASPSVLPTVEPPTDWEEMYNLVRQMRLTGPARDAAVDTMGCDRLFTADASPRDKRFHILVALMLSSQTKDTVNAVAMNRLHTELPPHSPGAAPGLNVENVLAVDPAVLNALIRQVGFHNNKTKLVPTVF
jgi:endonuclease-3